MEGGYLCFCPLSFPLYLTVPIQVYSSKSSLGYVLYNDEPPNASATSSGGHNKGVLALDATSGFWLVHSVPSLPDLTLPAFSWVSASKIYGQSFLCLSITTAQANGIAQQVRLINDHITLINQ